MARVFQVSQNSYIFALDFPPKQFCQVVSSLKKRVLKIFLKKKLQKNLQIKKNVVPLQREKVKRRCSSVGQSS